MIYTMPDNKKNPINKITTYRSYSGMRNFLEKTIGIKIKKFLIA